MATEIEHLHKDIEDIKKNITFIKDILMEGYELSDDAKKQLRIAGKTPRSEYIGHEEVRKLL